MTVIHLKNGQAVDDSNPLPVTGANSDGSMDVTVKGNIVEEATATIASSASLSDAVNLESKTLVGIVMPAAWTAANLTFQASSDGETYNDLKDYAGIEVAVVVGASQFIRLEPSQWIGVQWLKIRSGTSGTAVAQGAERAITLVSKAV